MLCLVFLVIFGAVYADPEYVTKKFCKEEQNHSTVFLDTVATILYAPKEALFKVDQNQCSVYTVVVDPCDQGPAFCNVKKNKKYEITLNLMPKFSAQKLKLSINGDVKNDGSFSTKIQAAKDGCGFLSCPLLAEERRIFDVDLVLDEKATGKFPVKLKLWNEDDESQACCVTFKVKVK